IGIPVAIAEIDRQQNLMTAQLVTQRGNQRAVLRIDRAHPAEMEIVLRHFVQPLAWHIPSAGDIFEKGNDVLGALRSAKRKEKQGVVLPGGLVESRRSPAA